MVEKRNITYKSTGLKIVGHLYVPDLTEGKKLPGIIVVSPWSSVKEQTSGLYANLLAGSLGFVTLAFDHRHYGESEGEPRCFEDPAGKIEDISAGLDFLIQQDFVDPDKLGAIGICAGGSYVVEAAACDRRIKAVAGITPVPDLRGLMFNDLKMGREGIIQTLELAAQARTKRAQTGNAEYWPIIDKSNDEKGFPAYVGSDATDYYYTDGRGKSPNYDGRVAVQSYAKVFPSSAVILAEWISPTPLLLIGGTKSASAHFQQETYDAAKEPKELYWVEGATHNDLYDKDSAVNPAVKKLESFFTPVRAA